MKYFIANWKANKNLQEALDWIDQFLKIYQPKTDSTIIICPPSPFLAAIKQKINQVSNLKLGVQDISLYEEGAYTGETTAKSLAGLVDYIIIGHSERRKYFNENNETVAKKMALAKKYQIEPIFCFRDKKDWTDPPVNFVAYEPPWAISKGYEDSMNTKIEETPENAVAVKNDLSIKSDKKFIYGGSVNPNNISEYLKFKEIDGFLVGGASLNPQSFNKIIG